MKKKILDTSVLLDHWQKCRSGKPLSEVNLRDVKVWAKELIAFHQSNAIVTPVYVEIMAGTMNRWQLQLTRAFLEAFDCVDDHHVTREDWSQAIRLAQRIPYKPHPRDLGDCLIRAIADRFHYEVWTLDGKFVR